MTGLAKDYVLNYLGRSSYHDHNGPLIGAIQGVVVAFYTADEAPEMIVKSMRTMCQQGMAIFEKGGALNNMMTELLALVDDKVNEKYLIKRIPANKEVRQLFEFLKSDSEEL